jgi:hypothetical protein
VARRKAALGLTALLLALLLATVWLASSTTGRVGPAGPGGDNGDPPLEQVTWLRIPLLDEAGETEKASQSGVPSLQATRDQVEAVRLNQVRGDRTGAEVRALAVSPTGSLWVATSRGVSRLADGEFHRYTSKDTLPSDQVFALGVTANGVAAATAGGLVWFNDPSPSAPGEAYSRPVLLDDTGPVPSVFTYQGRLWFAVSPPGKNSDVKAFSLDRRGRLQDAEGRLLKASGQAAGADSLPPIESHTLSKPIRKLLPGPGGRFVCERPGDKWWALDAGTFELAKSALPDEKKPLAALVSRAQVWALTKQYLQSSLEDPDPRPFAPDEKGRAGCLAPSRDDRLVWVGREGTLWQVDTAADPQHPRVRRRVALPPDVIPTAVAEDFLGRLWVGSNKGLLMADPLRSRPVLVPATGEGKLPERVQPRQAAGFSSGGAPWVEAGPELLLLDSEARPSGKLGLPAGRLDEALVGRPTFVLTSRGVFGEKVGGGWEKLAPAPTPKLAPAPPRSQRDRDLIRRANDGEPAASRVPRRLPPGRALLGYAGGRLVVPFEEGSRQGVRALDPKALSRSLSVFHRPGVERVSSVAVDPLTGDLLALVERPQQPGDHPFAEVSPVAEDLRIEESFKKSISGEFRRLVATPGDGGALYLVGNHEIWRRDQRSRWELHLDAEQGNRVTHFVGSVG